jgi:hypothetical protein
MPDNVPSPVQAVLAGNAKMVELLLRHGANASLLGAKVCQKCVSGHMGPPAEGGGVWSNSGWHCL